MRLYTTKEAIKATGIPRRTWYRYLQKKWVVPTERGNGRVNQNRFSIGDIAWSVVLKSLFSWGLHARSIISLHGNYYSLDSGEAIQRYLRDVAPPHIVIHKEDFSILSVNVPEVIRSLEQRLS